MYGQQFPVLPDPGLSPEQLVAHHQRGSVWAQHLWSQTPRAGRAAVLASPKPSWAQREGGAMHL